MSSLTLRIRGRLYGGFGALILFVVGLAAFAVWQLWAIRSEMDYIALRSYDNIRVVQISAELYANRRAILRYLFDHDEASFAESEKRLANVSALLEAAIKTSMSEDRKAEYNAVGKDVAELKIKRVALGDAVKQMVASRDLLFAEGDKMAADVQKFVDAADKTPFGHGAAELESKVLLVRVANWRFLATRDAKEVATFKTNVGNARQQIVELEKSDLAPNLAAILETTKANIAKYSDAFEKASTSLLQADELYYKAVAPPTERSIAEIEKAAAAIGEAFGKANAEATDRINSTIATQEIVSGAAALLGLLIAFLIARGIIGPLSGLTSGMKELAGGNFRVVLPGLGRKDEIGDMAQAIETFKVKAEEKARDEAEAKTNQDKSAAAQRKADMIRLADDFESAVGEIVETVSSASTLSLIHI